jgi:acyl-CoA thioester hydrolase
MVYEIEVSWDDVDNARVVFYGHMFYFVQRAEEAYFRGKGLPVSDLVERRNVGFPRIYAACSYRRPARFQDVLQVYVGIGELTHRGFQLLFKILKKADGTLIATGEVRTACTNFREFQRMDIPPDIYTTLEAMARETQREFASLPS